MKGLLPYKYMRSLTFRFNIIIIGTNKWIINSTMSRNALIALGLLRVAALEQKERQKQRAIKTKAYLKMTRSLKTDFYRLKNLRMDEASFFKLLGLVRPILQTHNNNLEEMDVVERLLLTLKYLATGCSLEELSYKTDFTHTDILAIIPATCRAIFKALAPYVKFPAEEKEWLDVADEFERKWNFSHCAGALSAIHIAIDKPSNDANSYLNHKGFHSVILVAVVNANYEFLYFDFGFYGGGEKDYIYTDTSFFENMINETMNLPKESPLPGTEVSAPYIFVSDTDYIIENFMRPYSKENLTNEEKIFNYRFCRAKRVADNAFGILYERFGVLHQNIYIQKDEADLNAVGVACCALHNYLAKTNKDYIPRESLDIEDEKNLSFQTASWRLKRDEGVHWRDTHPLLLLPQGPEKVNDYRGESVREVFTKYFNNEAKLPFQEQMVNIVPELM